jgi:hypothetical protein
MASPDLGSEAYHTQIQAQDDDSHQGDKLRLILVKVELSHQGRLLSQFLDDFARWNQSSCSRRSLRVSEGTFRLPQLPATIPP